MSAPLALTLSALQTVKTCVFIAVAAFVLHHFFSYFLLFSPAASCRTPKVLVLSLLRKAEQPLQAESSSDPVILSAKPGSGLICQGWQIIASN